MEGLHVDDGRDNKLESAKISYLSREASKLT